MIYTPGIKRGMSFAEYLAIPALSRSDLVKLLRSPAHYKYGEESEDTEATIFGSEYHCFILEPLRFETEYIIKPKFKGKGAKARKAAWEEEHEGMRFISADDLENLKGMRDRLYAHSLIAPILTSPNIEKEVVVLWKDPTYGYLCKIRIDILDKDTREIIDLKSCVDARPGPFKATAFSRGLHIQASWYQYGLQWATKIEHPFEFWAQEKEKPYNIQVHQANPDMLYTGQIAAAQALKIYDDCIKTDNWPGYPETVNMLGVPEWAKKVEAIHE